MKNRPTITRLFAMTGIILSLLVGSVPVQAAESVATQGMRLSKTQGIVAVFDTANKPQKATGNMKLLSGYNIATSAAGYAWINLDDTKLVKMDALSKVKVTSTGKNHVVDVVLGKAFVDVSKDLEKDETLVIRTSSVVTSINKGTSAEISVENGKTTIVGLDGKLDCLVADVTTGQLKSVEVLSGKKVEIKPTASGISVVTRASKKDDISGFSKLQIAQDSVLKDRIIKASGSKIGNISVADAVTAVSQDMVRQATEVIAMANESGKDVQSVINTMVGADISTKTLESANAATQSAPSSSTENVASSGSSSDSDNASESSASSVNDDSATVSESAPTKPVHVHSWDEGVVKEEATCVEDGIRTLTCTTCHQTKDVTIPAKQHILGEEISRVLVSENNSSNCTEIRDRVSKKCTVCNEEVSEVVRRYESHNFTHEISSSVPTCTEAGKQELQCSNDVLDSAGNPYGKCTAAETHFVEGPLGHAYEEKMFDRQSESRCYYLQCNRNGTCGACGDEMGHTLNGTVPTAYSVETIYIDCAERGNGCNYHAEYSWQDGRYVFVKWVPVS